MSNKHRLSSLEVYRNELQKTIRHFPAAPPVAVVASNEKEEFRFGIDCQTGKVTTIPAGVWSWVKGYKWHDLKIFLKQEGYEVSEEKAEMAQT